jgi:hypothetical protein
MRLAEKTCSATSRAEALKAALRVLQAGKNDQAYHPVKDPPDDMAVFGSL